MKRAIVLLLVFACTKRNDLPPEAWSADDYAKAGIAIDKPWQPADFTNAATVLAQIGEGHRERLPQFRGTKSGAVFAKLIAALPDDSAQPLSDRLGAHLAVYEAVNKVSKLYYINQVAPPPREFVELTGALLREAVVMTPLAGPFIELQGTDDPRREARLKGFEKMKAGFGMMLVGATLMAGDNREPEADRIALLEHVTAALPTLFPAAPAESQRMVRDNLAKLLPAVPAGKLRDAIVGVQRALP